MAALTPPHVPVRATMRVRFFHERSAEAMEQAINQWLAGHPDREIVEVCQSVVADPARPGERELVVSVWYIE